MSVAVALRLPFLYRAWLLLMLRCLTGHRSLFNRSVSLIAHCRQSPALPLHPCASATRALRSRLATSPPPLARCARGVASGSAKPTNGISSLLTTAPVSLPFHAAVPPPPSYIGSLLSWTASAAILAVGMAIEAPLLITWRLLRLLARLTASALPPLASLLSSSALLLLSLSYHCRIRYCYALLRCHGVSLSVINHNLHELSLHSQPYLFVQCNQHSLLEPVLFHASSYLHWRQRRRSKGSSSSNSSSPFLLSTPHFFINVEYGAWPLLGWVQGLTAVWVVRTWKPQARAALDRLIRRLRPVSPSLTPDSFYISPEGRRSPTGRIGEYKSGAAVAAIAAGAALVPVVMRGAYQSLPYGEWRVRPGHVTVVYDRVIDTAGLCYADRWTVTQQLRRCYERQLHQLL